MSEQNHAHDFSLEYIDDVRRLRKIVDALSSICTITCACAAVSGRFMWPIRKVSFLVGPTSSPSEPSMCLIQ